MTSLVSYMMRIIFRMVEFNCSLLDLIVPCFGFLSFGDLYFSATEQGVDRIDPVTDVGIILRTFLRTVPLQLDRVNNSRIGTRVVLLAVDEDIEPSLGGNFGDVLNQIRFEHIVVDTRVGVAIGTLGAITRSLRKQSI